MLRMFSSCRARRPSQQFFSFVVFGFGLSLFAAVGCGPKLPGGKVKITGTVMLDGSPLVCEGPGESFVNLSATSVAKVGHLVLIVPQASLKWLLSQVPT